MLIPRVKKEYREEGKLSFAGEINVCFSDEVAKSLAVAARELIPFPIRECERSEADFILSCDGSISEHTAYFIFDSLKDKAVAVFSDREGGRDAISVFSELLCVKEREKMGECYGAQCDLNGWESRGIAELARVRIEDYPDLKVRSFMQDVGRKHVPMSELKAQLLLMAKMRMNTFHFHFTEYVGFAVALSEFPTLEGAAVTGGTQYSEQEIREMVDYAQSLCIDVIPEVDLPAHANAITSKYPQLLCRTTDGVPPNGWTLCIGNEETYDFLEKLISAVAKLFPSKYFHLGTDEISMPDVDRFPKPVADFCRCSVCSSLGLTDTELFYRFLKRVYKIVKDLGKTLIVWNDQIDISHSPNLPRDILIEFWRVAAEGRGPSVGCSMQRFLDEGFDVINADFPEAYIDLYVEYDRLKGWNPKRAPASDERKRGKIIGADFCAWDVFRHFCHSVSVSTPFFADRFRNCFADDGGDELLMRASERLFGIKGFNVFDYTRKVIDLDESLDVFRADASISRVIDIIGGHKPSDASEEYIKSTYLSLAKKCLKRTDC